MEKDNSYIMTRKVVLYPVGDKEEVDRVYKWLRDGMEAQNRAMNEMISAMYVAMMQETDADTARELQKMYTRMPGSKKGSAYTDDYAFARGLPTLSSMSMKVRQDFNNDMKKGLKYGRVSLRTYKADSPLLVHVDYVRLMETNPHTKNGIYHEYASHAELLDHLYRDDFEAFIKFANSITFKIVFGNPRKSAELRSLFEHIFDSSYDVCGSSIKIDKNGKIILNLTVKAPKQTLELDENVVVGVDLGIAIPAMCALNNNLYERKSIGSAEDFLKVRTARQAQRRRLQAHLKVAKGGHGRKKKLAALYKFRKHEDNFVKTYNHFVSRNVVDFAMKHHAKYINVENLTEFRDTNGFILRNWSYYQLQNYITDKANRVGIIVRKVNSYRTSKMCSVCGSEQPNQRRDQSTFICANPDCASHKLYERGFNADFNAARNIAMSTEWQDGDVPLKEKCKQHRKTKDQSQ